MTKVELLVPIKAQYHTIRVDLPRVPVKGESFDFNLPETLRQPGDILPYKVSDVKYNVSIKDPNKDIGRLEKITVHLLKDF